MRTKYISNLRKMFPVASDRELWAIGEYILGEMGKKGFNAWMTDDLKIYHNARISKEIVNKATGFAAGLSKANYDI